MSWDVDMRAKALYNDTYCVHECGKPRAPMREGLTLHEYTLTNHSHQVHSGPISGGK